jgi:hypothetical protein
MFISSWLHVAEEDVVLRASDLNRIIKNVNKAKRASGAGYYSKNRIYGKYVRGRLVNR